MSIGELIVHLNVELVVRGIRQGAQAEVEEFPRKIWFGIKIDDRLPNRVDLAGRDHVQVPVVTDLRPGGTVRLADDGVIDIIHSAAKVAGPLRQGGRTGDNVERFVVAYSLDVTEEERLVFSERPAQRESILIALVVGFGSNRGRVKEIPGISTGALSKPPAAAVEIVGAALQGHIHNRSAVVSELRGEAVVLYFELLDNLHRRLVINVAGGALPLLGGADQGTINAHFGGGIALPVGDEVGACGIVIGGSGPGRLGDSTGKKCEAEEIAVGKRNVLDGLIRDFRPQGWAAGIQEGSGGVHIDGGGDRARIQREIDGALLVYRQHYSRSFLRTKSLQLNFER